MFFSWFQSCCNPASDAGVTWKQRRLKFLKSARDELETRLAAVNAAIDTIERQSREEN